MAGVEGCRGEAWTDAYRLGIGRCIALIEHTAALAVEVESPDTAAVIVEWSRKVVMAMRQASAQIEPGTFP